MPEIQSPSPTAFRDPVSASQAAFRRVLEAMSRPGTPQVLETLPAPPRPLSPTVAAIALTLLDHDTPVWLDQTLVQPSVLGYLRFHTSAPVVDDPAAARFALIGKPLTMPPLATFDAGSDLYPDRSATLVLQVATFACVRGARLAGPGIHGESSLSPAPLPPGFWRQAAANSRCFPRGVDMVFAGPDAIAALPRTCRIVAED